MAESSIQRAVAIGAIDRLGEALRETRDAFVLVPLEGPERIPRASAESACLPLFEFAEYVVERLRAFIGPAVS